MLWNFTSCSRLQLAFYLCDPFLMNNRNMAGNSVEKKMFSCAECKTRSKTKIQNVLLTSKPVTYCFRFEHHYQTGLF